MYNIHTYRKRKASQELAQKQAKQGAKKTYPKSSPSLNSPTLIPPSGYPHSRNPYVQAVVSQEVDEGQIYDSLKHRMKHHGKIETQPICYGKKRPSSAVSRQSSVIFKHTDKSASKKRPNSAIGSRTFAKKENRPDRANQNLSRSSTPATQRTTSRQRPQSAIERTLKRPSSSTRQYVRPASATTSHRVLRNTGHEARLHTPSRPSSAATSHSTFTSKHRSRSGLDLRRPSSAYRCKSATQRIVHVMPSDLRDVESHVDGPIHEEDMSNVMETVAEDCLQNSEYGKEDDTKWTNGTRGKYKNDKYIEWMGSEAVQHAYNEQLREAAWEQAQQEKLEKDAMEYINVKQRYKKQRALFKAQQQRNMLKSVMLTKEPRTMQQLQEYLRSPSKTSNTRPQSAIAYSRRSEPNAKPSHSPSCMARSTRQKRPQSARVNRRRNTMEWEENERRPAEDLRMLDKFEAIQQIDEED